MPNEESQYPNVTNCVIPFIQDSQEDKAMVMDNMSLVPRGEQKRERMTIKPHMKDYFKLVKLFCILVVLVMIGFCQCVDIHKSIHPYARPVCCIIIKMHHLSMYSLLLLGYYELQAAKATSSNGSLY